MNYTNGSYKIFKFVQFINEAYIDKDGVLRDFNITGTSDDLMDNDEFRKFVQVVTERTFEFYKLSEIYDGLSDNHKKIVIEELLYNMIMEPGVSKSILVDAISKYPVKFDRFMEDNISYWWSFGNGILEWSPELVEMLPMLYQVKAVEYMKKYAAYDLEMSKDMFNAFNINIQNKILEIKFLNII